MRMQPGLGIGAAILLLSGVGCVTAHVEHDQHSLSVLTSDQGELPLELTDSTVVVKDGQQSSVAQLKEGEEVRASYRVIDGKARALKIEATRPAQPRQDPAMMQLVPGDQSAPDDREPPVWSDNRDYQLLPDMH